MERAFNPSLPCAALCADRLIQKEVADITIQRMSRESLVQNNGLDQLVQSFDTLAPINPYQSVVTLARTAPIVALLLSGRTGVRESYRLHEHLQAALHGFETDYAEEFPHPTERKLLRTALLVHDMGKSLCVAHCQDRRQQAVYNYPVIENLLSSVVVSTLDEDDRRALRLLVGQDILGAVLKGNKGLTADEAKISINALQSAFPERYRHRCGSMMRAVYMSDATSYTSFRSYVAAETGMIMACRPELNGDHNIFTLSTTGKVAFVRLGAAALLEELTNEV